MDGLMGTEIIGKLDAQIVCYVGYLGGEKDDRLAMHIDGAARLVDGVDNTTEDKSFVSDSVNLQVKDELSSSCSLSIIITG